MLPDLEHQSFLKKMEKQVNNKQRLVPVFSKNPFKPAAKLMYGSKRYTNAIKLNSCEKYDKIIENHISKQARTKKKLIQQEISNPRQEIKLKLLESTPKNYQSQDQTTTLNTDFPEERRLRSIILKDLNYEKSTIESYKTPIHLPRLNQSLDVQRSMQDNSDSKISQIILTCHEEKDTLSTISQIIMNSHQKQKRHLQALKKNVNILSLDF